MWIRCAALCGLVALGVGCATAGRGGDPPDPTDGGGAQDAASAADAGPGADGAALPDGAVPVDAAPQPDAGPLCGNGVTDPGEECDDGNSLPTDGCLNNCVLNVCGDGHLNVGVEGCDDGNSVSGDGCTASCVAEFCGDGVVQSGLGEECEGGGQSQGCNTSCGTSGTETCQGSTCTWSACAPPAETCNGVDDDCDGDVDTASCLVTLYRFYNSSTGDHMYKTSNSPEPGYQLEGTSFRVYTSQVSGTVPLYQKFNGTDHLPTYSTTEGDPWYSNPVVLGYVATSNWAAAGFSASEICRYYASSSGDHFLFTYVSDANLPSVFPGYVREGCGRWVWNF